MDRDQIQTNAAAPPGCIDLGGVTFLVGQATDADLMAVRKHLKKHVADPLEMYAAVAGSARWRVLPKKVRDELAREAGQLHLRREKTLTAEMIAEMLMEAKHCRFMAWILLRKEKPDLTLESLESLITEDNAPGVYLTLARESGMDDLGN